MIFSTVFNAGPLWSRFADFVAAREAGAAADIQTTLSGLSEQVDALDQAAIEQDSKHASLKPLVERLMGGRSAIPQGEIRTLRSRLERVVHRFGFSESGPAIARRTSRPSPLRPEIYYTGKQPPYTPRPGQKTVVEAGVKHFGPKTDGSITKRGLARIDTGEGKTPIYSFIIKALEESIPHFKDAVVIMQSHQEEPARDVAQTTADNFPGEEVVYLTRGLTAADLDGRRFVVGTYSQVAQETTMAELKKWAGNRPVIFVCDEADMVVYKGHHKDGQRHPAWFQFLLDFGVFKIERRGKKTFAVYNPETPHTMIGATATLDRPDGIPLAPIWGKRPFYHQPMADGLRNKTLVRVKAKLVEMEIPAGERHLFREFTHVEGGCIVTDELKVTRAAQSDYAVKASVRAALDNMLMDQIGGGRVVRKGIGYAIDKPTLEKHMRWQQDLFDLLEIVYLIRQGSKNVRPISINTIIKHLGGEEAIDQFLETLERFLTRQEWEHVEPLARTAMEALRKGKRESVSELFETLYTILNGEVRAIKGRHLVASAVWDDMDTLDAEGQFHNRIGDRRRTMDALRKGNIDMTWSIGTLKRGFNDPWISLIVDNAPSKSRRDVVQRIGREMRPPDPRHPKDHSQKPDAIYVTVTANAEEHRIDLSHADVARAFGKDYDIESSEVELNGRHDGPTPWPIFDPQISEPQLDPTSERKLQLFHVGRRTAEAIQRFLARHYVGKFFDVEIMAYDAQAAGITIGGAPVTGDIVDDIMKGTYWLKENTLRELLAAWEADEQEIKDIMQIYIADRAEMKTVYGPLYGSFYK